MSMLKIEPTSDCCGADIRGGRCMACMENTTAFQEYVIYFPPTDNYPGGYLTLDGKHSHENTDPDDCRTFFNRELAEAYKEKEGLHRGEVVPKYSYTE